MNKVIIITGGSRGIGAACVQLAVVRSPQKFWSSYV